MAYTAQIIGGKHSGQTFEIDQLTTVIELEGAYANGTIAIYRYFRQPTVSPVKDGGIVFYAPERRCHP